MISRAQEFRQHDRVLDRLATALQTRPGYVAKTITAPVPDRAQAHEAPVAEPKLQVRQASRTPSEVRDSTAG